MSYSGPVSQRFGGRPVRRRSAFRLVGNVILAVHTTAEPTSDEWDEYIAYCRRAAKLFGDDLSPCRQLLLTDGGGPNPAQRAAILKATENMPGAAGVPRAVISTSHFVRGIVTALTWLERNVKLFEPDQIHQAIAFLGIEESTVAAIWKELESIDEEIGPIQMIRAAREAYEKRP